MASSHVGGHVCFASEAEFDGDSSSRFSGCIQSLSEDKEFWEIEVPEGYKELRSLSKFKDSTEASKTDEFKLSEP